jgi:hypothetical protein
MVLNRGRETCCLSKKFTSLFSTFLLFSTSLTPATFVFSTAARADNLHAVCLDPGDPIFTGETYNDLKNLNPGDPAVVINTNSLDEGPGFVKVANNTPGAPPTFKIQGLNLVVRDAEGKVTSTPDATLADLRGTTSDLTTYNFADIDNPNAFNSTGSGNAGLASVAGAAIGLPVLSTVEATNTEVQDLIRQRKELAAASATTVAAAALIPNETTTAPSPPATISKPATNSTPAATKGITKTNEASADQTDIVMDYDWSPTQSAWAQAFADYERHDNLAPGSGENLVRKQTTVGGMSGADVTYHRFTENGLETVQFGLLGGGTHITSNFSDFGDTTNARQTQDGGFVGAYGSYRLNNFSVDGFFKTDLLTLRQSSTVSGPVKCGSGQVLVIDDSPNALVSTTQQNGKVDEYTYTVGGNAYYRFDLDNGAYFEPLIGFIFSATNYGNGATALGLDNGQLFRLQSGARLGRSWDDDQNRTWSIALLGMLYSDLYVNGYTLDGFGLPPGASEVDEGKLRVLAQLEGNINLNNGLSFNGTVGVRGGQDVVGVGGRLGARVEW